MLLPASELWAGAGQLFSVRLSSDAQVGAGPPLRLTSLREFMQRPPTMYPGSCLLGSAATPQLLPPKGARAMGAPHSPLDPPKRLSHRPPSPVGGGTRAAAGDPVPKARSDLFLSVPRPWQGCTRLPVPAPSPRHEGPFARSLQVSLEQKSPSLHCSVASADPEFAVSSFLQMFYGLWVWSYLYVCLSALPPREKFQKLRPSSFSPKEFGSNLFEGGMMGVRF